MSTGASPPAISTSVGRKSTLLSRASFVVPGVEIVGIAHNQGALNACVVERSFGARHLNAMVCREDDKRIFIYPVALSMSRIRPTATSMTQVMRLFSSATSSRIPRRSGRYGSA